MLVNLIRGCIVYGIVVLSVRIMGKRQIGQLQPSELVVTILLSEIVADPIEDSEFPIINAVCTVLLLISLELFISYFSMKSPKLRKLVQGNSIAVIENGKINQTQMTNLRLTVDDLLEALRLKDVFDITEVEYAYVETNGNLSVELKPEEKPVRAYQLKIQESNTGVPHIIVNDGRIIKDSFEKSCLNEGKLMKLLKTKNLDLKDILILTADKEKVVTIVTKEKTK